MSKRLTTEEFIRRAREIHGDKYDYSKTCYTGYRHKVIIICPIHGEFTTSAQVHLGGSGCRLCRNEEQKVGLEDFIARAKRKHNDKYDYSKVKYVNARTKVCITCPIHGEFWQNAGEHLLGSGCPLCFNNRRGKSKLKNTQYFIDKAREIHGDRYDYSKVIYVRSSDKVCIICREHGEFWQTPKKHLKGQGCPKCKNKASVDRIRKPFSYFIERATLQHGRKYDYSLCEYNDLKTPIKIICPTHGVFEQTPYMHIHAKFGCPLCADEYSRKIIYGKGVNDILGSTDSQYYLVWRSMLCRCYAAREKENTYRDCSVCEEWFLLSNFKKWYDGHYVEGWALDKDILVKGNKVYSPETCCFVPPHINTVLTGTMICNPSKGITKTKKGYKCRIGKDGSLILLGVFESYDEALSIHKKARESYIHELAERYKYELEPRVYEAIANFKL